MDGKEESSILIIDDDSRNIFALSAVLRAIGYKTVSSPSAKDGIALMQRHTTIKVVLLDMMMPDMDGYAALAIIKSDRALSAIPVFAITAQAMVGDREKCLHAGANEYIPKPIDVDVLLDLLKAHNVEKQHER